MKTLITLIAVFVFTTNSIAGEKITSINNNGNWSSNNTWDKNRNPQPGDTVVIASGITVIVDENIDLSNGAILMLVYGKLKFKSSGSKLFFHVNSFVRIFTGGSISGTGTPSQSLAIGNSVVFQGNMADVTGPAYANFGSNGFLPFSETVLPVKFIGFSAAQQSGTVVINWSTSEEINASEYIVERSANGSSFSSIGSVKAAGNSSTIKNYAFTDRNPGAAVVSYRIRQVDQDGKTAYTSIKTVQFKSELASINIIAKDGKIVVM
nr:hypothetical protein [Flavisolibacter sp.]